MINTHSLNIRTSGMFVELTLNQAVARIKKMEDRVKYLEFKRSRSVSNNDKLSFNKDKLDLISIIKRDKRILVKALFNKEDKIVLNI